MKSNGLFLKDIPEKEKTEEICKLYHLPKTGGRFIATHFYSVTKSFAPTWYSCKSTSSWLKTQEEN